MNELIELYYNPEIGLTTTYKLYRKLNKRIPLKTIEKFINQQESYQIKKQDNRQKSYRPIAVYSTNNQWQIDLIDLSKTSHGNGGIRFLLCVVDVFSRKAFVISMKHKSDTTDATRRIISKEKASINSK